MIIIIIQIIARVYVGNKKTYFHMDEAYSYGLMNYDKLNIADNEDFFNNWHTKEYYSDYLEINKDEKKDIVGFCQTMSKIAEKTQKRPSTKSKIFLTVCFKSLFSITRS